jgi:hypothetical protein
MECLLTAGILYLIGVALVLAIKPGWMFMEDGTWKEFGIGRNPATHTWMPFWLFAVLWALISYIAVVVGYAIFGAKTSLAEGKDLDLADIPTVRNKKGSSASVNKVDVVDEVFEAEPEDLIKEGKSRVRSRARGKPMELPDGYYVLNTVATEAAGGIPKYVYIGKGMAEEV